MPLFCFLKYGYVIIYPALCFFATYTHTHKKKNRVSDTKGKSLSLTQQALNQVGLWSADKEEEQVQQSVDDVTPLHLKRDCWCWQESI